jgi:hypothetical protein
MYLGEPLPIDVKINSPLPYRNDPSPSFVIRVSSDDNLYWKDFGIDQENIGFSAVAFVQEYLGVDRQAALQDILQRKKEGKIPSPLTVKVKRLTKHLYGQALRGFEVDWWYNNLWITRQELEFFRIASLKGYYRDDKLIWDSSPGMPAYYYIEANKAYRPTARKGNKHRGIDNRDILEGWNQLPRNADHLIIQTSLKDVVCFRKMGYLGIAPPSENSLSGLLSKARELNGRFQQVYCMCDNDAAGRAQAIKLRDLCGWAPLFCPSTKDPSDSVKKYRNYFELSEFMSKFDLNKYKRYD